MATDTWATSKKAFNVATNLLKRYHFVTIGSTKEILVYDNNNGIYVPGGESVIEQNTQSDLGSDTSIHIVNEILGHIKRSTIIDIDDIDASDNIINVKNGLLNTNSNKLSKHTPSYVSITQIPIEYNPNIECNRIDEFLSSVFDKNDIEVIKEYIGFLLIKRYIFHKALMLTGDTGTGKTTFQRMIISFLGGNNISTRTLQDLCEDKFASADLFGKLANVSDDIPSNAIKYAGKFKQITGESRLSGQKKFQNSFDFYNNAKIIFSCNELPPAHNGDDAYYYRWIIVETKRRFTQDKANRNLISELTTPEEMSGLLNLALKYRKKLLDQNDFSYDRSIEYSVRRYMLTVKDSVAKFAGRCIQSDGNCYIEKQKLYETYEEWCVDTELPAKSDNAFHRRLQRVLGNTVEVYRPTVDGHQITAYKGIKLKDGYV